MNKFKKALYELRSLVCLDISKQYYFLLQCDVLQELVDLVESEQTLEILRELHKQKHDCTENKIAEYGFCKQRTGADSIATNVIIETKVVKI